MSKIAIVGAGYVGLVTGVCFAQKDNFVTIVERDENKIKSLLDGQVPFYEPGLDLLLKRAISSNKIVFVKTISELLKNSPEVIFSCVGTPSMKNGDADLSAVYEVARQVGQKINSYCLFINKSTVPVGTAKKVKEIICEQLQKRKLNINFDVASNPEFLKEGSALDDFLVPDRVVIGVYNNKSSEILQKIYKPFLTERSEFLVMRPESSELTKYASNSMLATRISFMNQLALLADKVGANIADIKLGMAADRRIGRAFLNAGVGYGGSCFPKDIKALIKMGEKNESPMNIVNAVDKANDHQRIWFLNNILKHYGEKISGKTIGIWGLAFKPETDDIRYAPSIDIIKGILEKGAKIVAYDPQAEQNIKSIFGNKISFSKTAKELLSFSDSLVILTEWKEFLKFEPASFLTLKDKVIFDGRNCFSPSNMQSIGINYFCIGSNNSKEETGINLDALAFKKVKKFVELG